MTIQATSITKQNIIIVAPNGDEHSVESVSYTAANGQASYTFSRTFSFSDNGIWKAKSSTTNAVLDQAGNAVAATDLGSFTVNIPTPTDTSRPTATLVSITPTTVTIAGNAAIAIVVSYSDS